MHIKTKIVLSNANLTALLISFEALEICFGEGLIFRNSIIRQKDKESLNYEVEIWGTIPPKNLGGGMPATFHVFITFALGSDLRFNGLAEMKIIGWDRILNLLDYNDMCIVSEESKSELDELKERMRAYYRHR